MKRVPPSVRLKEEIEGLLQGHAAPPAAEEAPRWNLWVGGLRAGSDVCEHARGEHPPRRGRRVTGAEKIRALVRYRYLGTPPTS